MDYNHYATISKKPATFSPSRFLENIRLLAHTIGAACPELQQWFSRYTCSILNYIHRKSKPVPAIEDNPHATVSKKSATFSPSRFLQDIKVLAHTIGAPYSELAVKNVLTAFEECFDNAVVAWRTTDRPNDTLNYRLFLRRQMDTISIAIDSGHLMPDDPLVQLLRSWSSLFNGETEQWLDFDPNAGLAKTWLNLGDRRPVDDVLHAAEVPAAIRAHGPTFHGLGLKLVTFVAVDYQGKSVNLYFLAPSLSRSQAAQYTDLAGCSPPTDEEFDDMLEFCQPDGFHFAVTMDYATGNITRVAFYALDLPPSRAPTMDDRIKEFLAKAPSYDQHQTKIVGWSYGVDNVKYMKVESSYAGELKTLGTLVRES